jgi:hypothetical protein
MRRNISLSRKPEETPIAKYWSQKEGALVRVTPNADTVYGSRTQAGKKQSGKRVLYKFASVSLQINCSATSSFRMRNEIQYTGCKLSSVSPSKQNVRYGFGTARACSEFRN